MSARLVLTPGGDLDIDGYRHMAQLAVREAVSTDEDRAAGELHEGRDVDDPFYRRVIEGRSNVRGGVDRYSSCGDLCHWMLFRLGVRSDWINRNENSGWKMVVNTSRLIGHQRREAEDINGKTQFESGDIIMVGHAHDPWNSGVHVCVFLEDLGDEFLTADYGQPGGKLCRRKVKRGKHLTIGSRRAMRVLRLDKVLVAAHAAGELVEADREMFGG